MSQPSSSAVRRGRSANAPCGPSSVRAMRQELGAIRHLDRLDEDLAGLGEGGMDGELRAAAAEARSAENLARRRGGSGCRHCRPPA